MEENVALDSSKQKKFVKSIKKLIKKGGEDSKENDAPKAGDEVKKSKRRRPDRGLVYLSHIPHGFYEHEMTQYFKQFGMVTNVRVIRSKRTGNSKGYAFVEFKEPSVAEIVAETMNNYLMGKRIIKAAYIPPEKQRPKAMRKHWNRVHNPGAENRLKMKKAYNTDEEEGSFKRAKKIISNLNKTKSKLSDMGINYDFFTPVDIPQPLLPLLENKSNDKSTKQTNNNTQAEKTDNKTKKNKDKIKTEVVTIKKANKKADQNDKNQKGTKLDKAEPKAMKKVEKPDQKPTKTVEKSNKKKLDKTLQKNKEDKLKAAGVKSANNFIKIQQESEDSDSSLGFDSDEYEKMIDDDSDMSGEESEDDVSVDDNDEGGDSEEEDDDKDEDDDEEEDVSEEADESEEEEAPPPKKGKGKKGPIIAQPPKINKNDSKLKKNLKPGKAPQVKENEVKRKFVQNQNTNSKKPKFEKQSLQPMKKQFKKKK